MEALTVGLGPDQWLQMWDSGFTHDHSQQADSSSGEHRHHGQEEDQEHGTVNDVNKSGKVLKVDRYLFRHISTLTGGNSNEAILVSLCGDTKDLEWLSSKGYSVVGVELSETAVKKAFENACAGPIPYRVTTHGDIKEYSATDGKKLRVFVGDFFGDGISVRLIGQFNCVWDSHGIVALPVSMQKPYAEKLLTFVKPGGKILFSSLDYDITTLKSSPAPAPVSSSLLSKYYPGCNVSLLEDSVFNHNHLEGIDHITNPVILVEVPK